jgi:flagellar basal body P-ring protein FlgI
MRAFAFGQYTPRQVLLMLEFSEMSIAPSSALKIVVNKKAAIVVGFKPVV